MLYQQLFFIEHLSKNANIIFSIDKRGLKYIDENFI